MRRMFPMAPMSADIRVLTTVLLLLPVGFVVGAATVSPSFLLVAGLVPPIYALVWLVYRPGSFVITNGTLEAVFPVRRLVIERHSVLSARVVDRGEIKQLLGAAVRIGAGGLWGGFGLLWTKHRGLVQMYISRSDELVWIERGAERCWLISPSDPHRFVSALVAP